MIAEARTWLRTPYHHTGRIKGVGVDCVMLLAEVYEAAGVMGRYEAPAYVRDWMLHRSEELYLTGLQEHARAIAAPETGDIALFRFGRCFSHAAIVVAWPEVIHAYAPEKGVVLGDASRGLLAEREVKFFSIWG